MLLYSTFENPDGRNPLHLADLRKRAEQAVDMMRPVAKLSTFTHGTFDVEDPEVREDTFTHGTLDVEGAEVRRTRTFDVEGAEVN